MKTPVEPLDHRRHGDAAMIALGDADLTLTDVEQLAGQQVRATLSADALARIDAGHRALIAASRTQPVYGLSTGVGARRTVPVERDIASCLRLWQGHALRVGPAVDADRTRAMVLVRVAQIARGGSGVSATLAQAALTLIAEDRLPAVTFGASLGTGDLAALASVALHVHEHSRDAVVPSDGLPFMSSSALTLADAALTLQRLCRAIAASTALAAAVAVATSANAEHFAQTPLAGQPDEVGKVAAVIRAALPVTHTQARVQDPFSLRLIPHSVGSLRGAWKHCASTTLSGINGSPENPLVDAGLGTVAHTGNFYTIELALACESLLSALAHEGTLMLSRLSLLLDHRFTGQPDFLTDGLSDSNGLMMLEYAAGAALGEIRDAAAARGGHGIHISHGVEEHAPFTPAAVRRLAAAGEAYRMLIACLAVALARLPQARQALPPVLLPDDDRADRDLTATLQAALTEIDTMAAEQPESR